MKYRKKPIVIEAVKYDKTDANDYDGALFRIERDDGKFKDFYDGYNQEDIEKFTRGATHYCLSYYDQTGNSGNERFFHMVKNVTKANTDVIKKEWKENK